MRSVFISLFLVLTFCVATLAQTNEVLPCPKIDIRGSFENIATDGTVIYTAVVGSEIDKYNVKYKWTVKTGEIVEGQATTTIKVKASVGIDSISLEIEGLPKNCSNTTSETSSYIIDCVLPQTARKIDEFSVPASRITKERLDGLITDLLNDPNVLGRIIERFSFQTSPKIIQQKNNKIIDYLKSKGIKIEQFELLNASSEKNLTELFIIPTGATIPTCDNCTIVQP